MNDNLVSLGVGEGSKNEAIKLQSAHLRGTIAKTIASGATHFDEADLQLLKFHGSYQQENRDRRREHKEAGTQKAYQFMVRSRIPGGALSAEQYLAHDAIANAYGNGTIRLTTRQGIQLHGVLIHDLLATIKAINASLLSTLAACGDVNRNVMACAAPARDPAHLLVLQYAHRIAMHLAPRTRAYHEIWVDGRKLEPQEPAVDEEPIYGDTYLPRKFKIGVAMPDDNCIDVYTQDIGFVAELDGVGGVAGFTVLIGGGMGSTHGKSETYPRLATPLCFVSPDEVTEVAGTIVTIQRDYGDRKDRRHARMKYVVEERGIEWFRDQLEERLGRHVADPRDVKFIAAHDHLGWHRQLDASWSLGLYVENGRIADTTRGMLRTALREIVAMLRPRLRITPQQNIILTGIPAKARKHVGAMLRHHGVIDDPNQLGLRRGAIACPALPTCGLAVAEAERALPSLVERIERDLLELGLQDEPIGIRMTGCPNGCARPRMGDIGIVGRSLGLYDIFLGGDSANTRLNDVYAQGVAYDAIAPVLHVVFELWKRERLREESFGDFTHRFGAAGLRNAVQALRPA